VLRGGAWPALAWETDSWVSGAQADCEGHGAGDLVLVGRDRLRVKGAAADVTVAGLMEMLYPDNMHKLDYIYDTSDWAYCGIDILKL